MIYCVKVDAQPVTALYFRLLRLLLLLVISMTESCFHGLRVVFV